MVVVLSQPRLIFIEEPRAASRSTHIWLVEHMGGISPWKPKNPQSKISSHTERHMGPVSFKRMVRHGQLPRVSFIDQELASYSYFAFVRNPFDTVVTYYCKAKIGQLGPQGRDVERKIGMESKNFTEFLRRILNELPNTLSEVSHHARLNHVEHILRFEQGFPRVLFEFLEEHGITVPAWSRKKMRREGRTSGKKKNWRDYYDEEAVEIVSGIYPEYLEKYGYTFDE